MSRLENWGDLFKYSKELLDDDYNHGQALVIKSKNKSADASSVSTYFLFRSDILHHCLGG